MEERIIDGKVYRVVEETPQPETIVIEGKEYQAVPSVQPSVAPKGEIVVEPTNSQVSIVEENSALTDFTFERVNLNDPKSILSYCDSIKSQITGILESTAEMSVNQEQAFISDDVLKTITSFDESLEEADREAAKQEGFLARVKKGLLLKLGSEKVEKEEQMKTYAGRYRDYIDKINLVIENVEVLSENALNDINLRKAIAEQMKPLIEQMDVMIKTGEADKEAYDQETTALGQVAQTDDEKYLVQYRSQISDIFAKKLVELQKVHILYKEQLQQYNQQQFTDMNIVMQAQSYISDQAPILKAQGSTQIFNKGQGERITQLAELNEASNLAVENNTRNLEANVKASVDLMVNGGFKTETIASVQQSLQRGNEVLKNGKKQLILKTQKDNEALKKINAQLDESQREIMALIEQTAGAVQAIEDNSSKNSFRSSLPRRRK